MADTVPRSEQGTFEPARVRPGLVVYHRDGADVIPLEPGFPVVVGRTSPTGHVYEDATLSARHASFELAGDVVRVRDLGSTNGTFVNGKRTTDATLGEDDEVAIGGLVVTLLGVAGERSAGLDGHDRFSAAIEAEIARSRFFRRSAALVIVRAADRSPVRRFVDRVRARLRPIDRCALYSETLLEVLLPEATSEDALAIARALVTDGREPRLIAAVAAFPENASSADELVERGLSSTHGEGPLTVPSGPPPTEPIASSAGMRELFATAERLARGVVPVLITGETGTGKEVLARYVHDRGPRRAAPFLAVNCGAITPTLLESTLFGHEKGAFTGAAAQHRGVFEAADDGTVFLDEIGELPPRAQAALLRVLETRRVVRVGGTKDLDVAARVVAATHRDLDAMVGAGAFRADLLYRLNPIVLHVPPLRERRAELPELAERFLRAANTANGTHVRAIDPDALAALVAYAWPGNVRELRNAIERAAMIARGDAIGVDELPERVRACEPLAPPAAAAAVGEDDFRTRIDRAEHDILVAALRDAAWNQSECARRLRMPLRTLVYKIKAHGIRRP